MKIRFDKNSERFIKKNLKLLTSEVRDQIKQVKSEKNAFWRKIKGVSFPKNPDLAIRTVRYLIDKNKITNQQDLDGLLAISDYIKKYLYIKDLEKLVEEFATENKRTYSKTFLSSKDLKDIKIEEYVEKIVPRQVGFYEEDSVYDYEIKDKPKILRKYGYDILINRFELLLRRILINEVLIINYGLKKWIDEIPKGVIQVIETEKEINLGSIYISDFFEEVYLWGLKEIAIFSDHYKHLKCLTGGLNKTKFIELMDDLHIIRKKIAHAKSTFSGVDFNNLLFSVKQICQGEVAKDFIKYIDNRSYKNAEEIPLIFYSEYICPHNLPVQDYDLDGGFVGRKVEIEKVMRYLYSAQDRIISITGAGGIGKTAVALKVSYIILADDKNNPFEAIIWFSAKESRLTAENGIVPIESGIKCCEQLVKDVLKIVDNDSLEVFVKNNLSHEIILKHLNNLLSTHTCLLVIDNLETIEDKDTIEFIKDVPRPSQVLITSRRGLGEIERRFALPDFNEKDAVKLFRIISKEKNRIDLLKLDNKSVLKLVKKVKYYPLLIKWSIGKICLGKDVNSAFSEIYSGTSEIAEFVFSDVFELISENSKILLYSMIIYGDKPIDEAFLKHLANLDNVQFEDSIGELVTTSFIIPEISSTDVGIKTSYNMLSLTRGFVQHKLDNNPKEFRAIQTRYFNLSRDIESFEKSQKSFHQSIISLGIKDDNDKISFIHIKSAKNFERNGNIEKAKENFENAIKIAPGFAYALKEYAKFENSHGHYQKSEDLYQRAIIADPDYWSCYFDYGMSLKNQNLIPKAIQKLRKAHMLNPNHLPIFNELGRCLTFNGEYEKANEQFEAAKIQKKYPNYRHQFITLQHQANNYKRWSEAFFQRKDYEGGFSKLFNALEVMKEANSIKFGDMRYQLSEKKICIDIAINYCEIGKFEEAIPYFDRCFKKIVMQNGMVRSYDEEMARANYYKAKYGYYLKRLEKVEIITHIKKGQSMSQNINLTNKLKNLLFKVSEDSRILSQDRKVGIVDWVNVPKQYGIINCDEGSYMFFRRNFVKYIKDSQFALLEGKAVSFSLINNPKKKGAKLAVDLYLDDLD